jgi:UDP-N-acetylglucosamine 2-epimerase (non-hydrolysing)
MAPVIEELERYPEHFKSIVCVTAQHRQMLDQVLNLFKISRVMISPYFAYD